MPIRGPRERTTLKTLLIKPKTVPIPFDYLHAIAALVAENKHGGFKRNTGKSQICDSSQAIQPLTHISGAADQIYLLAGTLQHNKTPPWLMGYGEEFNALGGGGIGTGHLTLTDLFTDAPSITKHIQNIIENAAKRIPVK